MSAIQPQLKTFGGATLVGMHTQTSIANDNTPALWQRFMPRRKEIQHPVSGNLISVQVYHPNFKFRDFTHDTIWQKWATVEVSDTATLPDGMEVLQIPAGEYVVFTYTGTPATFGETLRYLFAEWLPARNLRPDASRPHFEVLGEKYKHNHPDSEEEVWVAVAALV